MNTFTKNLIAATTGTLLAAGAQAFDVTATVNSTISVTQTTPFTVGSLYIQADGVAGANPTIVVAPATPNKATPAAGAAALDGKFVSLGGAQAGVLAVSGAASFTSLTITSTAGDDLTHDSGNPSLPAIEWSAITTLPATTVTTDSLGAATITVGGTFTTEDFDTALVPYTDGDYTGTYTVEVAY